ncbi:acyl carrier protein [Kitasatospora sp. P5_F3]
MDHARTAAERRITQQIRRMLDSPATLTDAELVQSDLFDLGLTSVTALVLTAWLEAEFGVTVGLRDVFADPYVETLAELVTTEVAAV